MKKLLVVMAALAIVIALAVPSYAQYAVNWTDTFDWATAGANITGNNGWIQTGGTVNASPRGSLAPTSDGVSGSMSALQPGGLRSAMKKDLKYLNVGAQTYYTGMVSAWVYDPYPVDSNGVLITNQVDTRVGLISNTGTTQGDSGAMTYAVTAGITDTRGAFWTAYATSGLVVMNGAAVATAPNYTLTAAGLAPAPRVAGWNSMLIAFTGDPVAKTMSADFYINIDWADPQPNARLDTDGNGTGTRYAAISSFAGLYVGSGSTFATNAWVDDVTFSGDREPVPPVPEPSSLLALGTGLFGLVGLIRRRK